jgi:hypothetical protein
MAQTRIDPAHIAQQMDEAGREWVNLDAAAKLLEETKAVVRAELERQYLDKGMTSAKAETMAQSDPTYRAHVELMVENRRKANLARVLFDSVRAEVDLIRTVESTRRAEMRL